MAGLALFGLGLRPVPIDCKIFKLKPVIEKRDPHIGIGNGRDGDKSSQYNVVEEEKDEYTCEMKTWYEQSM